MLQDSKPKTPQSADKWLKNTDKLHTLYLKQQKELVLKEIICRRTGLQTDAFYIAAIHAETLVLQTNNATIATQLRMASSEILSVISDDNQWKNSSPLYFTNYFLQNPCHAKIHYFNIYIYVYILSMVFD